MTIQGKEKKRRSALPETAQGLTTPIVSYVGEKSSVNSVIPAWFEDVKGRNNVIS